MKEETTIAVIVTFLIGMIIGMCIIGIFAIPVCDCKCTADDNYWNGYNAGWLEGWNISRDVANCYNNPNYECRRRFEFVNESYINEYTPIDITNITVVRQ